MQRNVLSLASLLLLAAIALGASSTNSPTTAPATGRSAPWDSYKLVLTRNIFSRDRTSYSSERPRFVAPTAPRSRDYDIVLTGIGLQEGARLAFFEDNRTGERIRAVVGQSIGEGTVTSILPDKVEYRNRGSNRTVSIGENLAGSEVSLSGSPSTSSSSSSSSASSQPASGPAAEGVGKPADTAPSGGNDILEKMRQRRLQEMKQ